MLMPISDSAMNSLTVMIGLVLVAFIQAFFAWLTIWFTAKKTAKVLEAQGVKTAEVLVAQGDKVAEVLEKKNETVYKKLDSIAETGEKNHALANGNMAQTLLTGLISAKTLAETSKKPEHVALMELAQRNYDAHKSEQEKAE